MDIKFICDVHLGKLARLLRLLGFDTIYRNDLQDKEIIRIAKTGQRVILTMDQGILGNKSVQSYQPDSSMPGEQIREVLSIFNLREHISPFSRCMDCNGEIGLVEKGSVKDQVDQVPNRIGQIMEQFYQCQGCGKIYWQGSHYAKMNDWVDAVKSSVLG